MNGTTLLFRQIHPSWVQSGRVTSQAFKPTPKDQKRLSVYDGDQITAKDSWNHHTKHLGYKSAGVLAVNVGECQSHDLIVETDPEPFPAHIVIVFKGCTNSQIEKKSKFLKKAAEARGWLYEAGAEV
jgi:hypothetical protein